MSRPELISSFSHPLQMLVAPHIVLGVLFFSSLSADAFNLLVFLSERFCSNCWDLAEKCSTNKGGSWQVDFFFLFSWGKGFIWKEHLQLLSENHINCVYPSKFLLLVCCHVVFLFKSGIFLPKINKIVVSYSSAGCTNPQCDKPNLPSIVSSENNPEVRFKRTAAFRGENCEPGMLNSLPYLTGLWEKWLIFSCSLTEFGLQPASFAVVIPANFWKPWIMFVCTVCKTVIQAVNLF